MFQCDTTGSKWTKSSLLIWDHFKHHKWKIVTCQVKCVMKLPTHPQTWKWISYCIIITYVTIHKCWTKCYSMWEKAPDHYRDVTMSLMASQITSILTVCKAVCSGANQNKHQSFASLAFARGIHRWPEFSRNKGPVTRKMFSSDNAIMTVITFRLTDRTYATQLNKNVININKYNVVILTQSNLQVSVFCTDVTSERPVTWSFDELHFFVYKFSIGRLSTNDTRPWYMALWNRFCYVTLLGLGMIYKPLVPILIIGVDMDPTMTGIVAERMTRQYINL